MAAALLAQAPEVMEVPEQRGYTGEANRQIGARHAHFAEDFASPLAYSNMYQDRYSLSISLHSEQNTHARFVSCYRTKAIQNSGSYYQSMLSQRTMEAALTPLPFWGMFRCTECR